VTAAVVSLIATVIGFVVWLIKRKAANAELPGNILKKYEDEARKIIADGGDVNALLDDRLRAIGRNTRGQGSGASQGGADKPEGRLPSS
jgi:hypothetical protein